MKRLMILAVAVGLGLLWLITGCGDDGGGPSNSKPVIQSLSAAMDTVDTSGSCTINCVASDADGDSLSYQWHAGLGVIAGSGPSVVWTAPDIAGACTVSVTVSDDRGGSASDGTCIEVYGGTLLITTGNGLIAVDLDGSSFIMSESSGSVEVLGTRIFVKYGGHSMREYNSATQVVGSISIPDTIPYPYIPVVLPDGGFAFLDNANDRIDFIDSQGNYLLFIEMPEVSPHNLQAVDGVIVGNTLIVSETGTRKVIEVDLSSHTASIFKDLTSVGGWIGAIDYSEGLYYICQCQKLHYFTEDGDATELCSFDQGCLTGVTVYGGYAYIVINSPGELYRIDIESGTKELLLDGLSYPKDIEYTPAEVEPPVEK